MKPLLALSFFCCSLFADGYVFCYHRFDDPKPKHKAMNISSEKFTEHLNYLSSNGYKMEPLSKVVANVKSKKPYREKTATITVDDAYKSFYDHAFPILKAKKIPFTLFVYVEAIKGGYKDFMTWEQIKEVAKYGEIGLHSYAHKDLTKMSPEELQKDTADSFEIFTKMTGQKPKYYAYPFGHYNKAVQAKIKSFGFESIVTVDAGAVNENSDVFSLERIAMSGNDDFKLALGVKPLDVSMEKVAIKDGQWVIKGNVQNFDKKEIKLYVNKKDKRVLELNNSSFETLIDPSKINSKQKLIFSTDDHRYRAKLIEKD